MTFYILSLSIGIILLISFVILRAKRTSPAITLLKSLVSVFFLLSDLILSGTYFGEGKDGPAYIISNHILYYIGQYMIASCVLWIGG